MPPPVRTPRRNWIDAGLRALASGGSQAVRIETLAKALGVTKGGFYWHFRDRQELLDAMLQNWEETFVDDAIATAERGGGSARERLRRLFTAADDLTGSLSLELAVRDWARRDSAVAEQVARVDDRRLAYLRPLFAEFCDDSDDVEGRCLLTLTLFLGESLIITTPRQADRSAQVRAALRHLLR